VELCTHLPLHACSPRPSSHIPPGRRPADLH
jgi:hypothetical protein